MIKRTFSSWVNFNFVFLSEYNNLLYREWEYDGSIKMTWTSRLFPKYLFRMHYNNSTDTTEYDTGSFVCQMLFFLNYDAGHFDALQKSIIYLFFIILAGNRSLKIFTKMHTLERLRCQYYHEIPTSSSCTIIPYLSSFRDITLLSTVDEWFC